MSPSTTSAPPFRLTSPEDVVALVPTLLGFHPQSSVVAVAVQETHGTFIQRVDIPDDEDAEVVAVGLAKRIVAQGGRQLLLVCYEDVPGASDLTARYLHDHLLPTRCVVSAHLLVRAGRWYCGDVDDPLHEDCDLDRGGRPVPPALGHHDQAFDASRRGQAPLGSRGDLVKEVRPTRDAPDRFPEVAQAVTALGDSASLAEPTRTQSRIKSIRAWGTALQRAESGLRRRPTTGHTAQLLAGLRDPMVRDLLVTWVCPGSLPLDDFEAALVEAAGTHWPAIGVRDIAAGRAPRPATGTLTPGQVIDLLSTLCRTSPQQQRAPVLSVLGWLHWWLGDGARTNVCIEEALRLDPTYTLAQLLDQMVRHAFRPYRAEDGSGHWNDAGRAS